MGCGASNVRSVKPEQQIAPKKVVIVGKGDNLLVSSTSQESINQLDGFVGPGYDSRESGVRQEEKKQNGELVNLKDRDLQSIIRSIGLKLQLPESMTNNCIQTLNGNGIFIIDPLLEATIEEWANLGLPLAVSKELKERVAQIKKRDEENSNESMGNLQRDSTSRTLPRTESIPKTQSSPNKNSTYDTLSKRVQPLIHCDCGKSISKDQLEVHLQSCPARVTKSTEVKKGPNEAVQLAATSGFGSTRGRRGSKSTSRKGIPNMDDLDPQHPNDGPSNHHDSQSSNHEEKVNPRKAFMEATSRHGSSASISRNRGSAIVAALLNQNAATNGNQTQNTNAPASTSNTNGTRRFGNPNGAFGFTEPVTYLEDEISVPSISNKTNSNSEQVEGGNALASSLRKKIDTEKTEDNDELFVMAKTFKNGDKYSGQFNSQNKQHGRGKYTFVNGDVYEGDFKNGFFDGNGTFRRVNGDYYSGAFKQDLFEGRGVYVYKDGERYEGEYTQGDRNGHGKYFYKNGNTFEGEFRRGDIMGEGVYTFANDDRYEGVIQNGTFSGGKYTFSNGDAYQGHYKGSIPHGLGVMIYANKDRYEGNFYESKRHGQGKYISASGKIHEGQYVMGKREGPGKFVDEEGIYEGDFRDGKMSGKGAFTFHNGDWYEGDFGNNVFEGQGVMVEQGCKYEGSWLGGLRHGYGKWVTEEGDTYEGEFRAGTMDGQGSYSWSNNNNYRGQFRGGKPNGRGVFNFADTGEMIQGEFVDGRPANPNNRIRNVDIPNQALTLGVKDKVIKTTPIPAKTKVHTPFLGQYGDSLF